MPENRRLFLFPLLTFLLLALPTSAPTSALEPSLKPAPKITPGTTEKVEVDERVRCCKRSYLLHVPAGFEPADETPRPLVLALHGGLATAKTFEEQTGFSEIADREGFFVAYPNGMGIGPLLRHWNGGYCCAKAVKIDLDDPAYLDRVIERVAATYPVDRKRVFVVGYSNGGMLAYWYASTRADQIAGLGVWGSSIGDRRDGSWTWPDPVAPVPTMVAHGFADPRLPWEKGDRKDQNLRGAVGSAQAWADANGCAEPPASERTWSDMVERRTWCAESEAPVVLLGVEGWDHDWPGPKLNKRPASDPLHRFHLAEEMWSFFAGL